MADQLTNPKEIELKQTGLKIKFNPGGLIAALIRSAADIFTGQPSAATFAEWVKAVKFETDKEQQAFGLVSMGLMKAIEYQLKEPLNGLDLDDDEHPVFLKIKIRYNVFNELNKKEFSFL